MQPEGRETQDARPGRRLGRRKIIHVDMDAFFASVEQRDNPDLRGRPVAVGGLAKRGVVAAASYEARRYGVRSAMPAFRAAELCRSLVFVPPRFDVYRHVSSQIREIFLEYTRLVEPLSLDEAYLDVTENLKGVEYATAIAKAVRARIRQETGLTASAGVSYNKFLAKMASGQRKPDGMFVIPPENGQAFVAALPIEKFHGIGPATARRMKELGVGNGAELKALTLPFLRENFGKAGGHFYAVARGEDDRPVEPDRERKSIGAETTFERDAHAFDEANGPLSGLCLRVFERCRLSGMYGRTVTVKTKRSDFRQTTRSTTVGGRIDRGDVLFRLASALLRQGDFAGGVRLVGLTVSGFDEHEPGQLAFDL
jgi:DNA polymerase-4